MKGNFKKTFIFRLDEKTEKKMHIQAVKRGISTSQYLRMLVDNDSSDQNRKKLYEIPSREQYLDYKKMIYEINKIGTNINQIAKNNNSMLYSDKDKAELLVMMKELNTLMKGYYPGKII